MYIYTYTYIHSYKHLGYELHLCETGLEIKARWNLPVVWLYRFVCCFVRCG
jgi:hypothetical protein